MLLLKDEDLLVKVYITRIYEWTADLIIIVSCLQSFTFIYAVSKTGTGSILCESSITRENSDKLPAII